MIVMIRTDNLFAVDTACFGILWTTIHRDPEVCVQLYEKHFSDWDGARNIGYKVIPIKVEYENRQF